MMYSSSSFVAVFCLVGLGVSVATFYRQFQQLKDDNDSTGGDEQDITGDIVRVSDTSGYCQEC